MLFISLLIFVTFSIACTAAIFSVYGLAQLFSGTFYAVILMGSALEAGKLISASFLYRYWKILTFPIKSYLCTAIFILMVITSTGIFGFLTKSYVQDTASLNDISYTLETLQREQQTLLAERSKIENFRSKSAENIIDTTTEKWKVAGNSKIRKEYEDKYKQLTLLIQNNDTKIGEIKNKVASMQSHVGPIVYVAKAFNATVDDATKYIVLMLISVFDPLAVVLTIGCNIALSEHKKSNNGLGIKTDTNFDSIVIKEETNISSDDSILEVDKKIEAVDDIKDIDELVDERELLNNEENSIENVVQDEPEYESIGMDQLVQDEPEYESIGMDQLVQTIPVIEVEDDTKPSVNDSILLDLSSIPQSTLDLPTPSDITFNSVSNLSSKNKRKDAIAYVRNM